MTHVHYKFSSKRSYDTAVFDGPHVTLRDLKSQIMGMEKLRTGDLQITDAQTKEAYTDDDGQIPKGSSVIVRRIPSMGAKSGPTSKTRSIERQDLHHTQTVIKSMDGESSSSALPLFFEMTNLANADVSEEDKLKAILNQSTFDTTHYKSFSASLPANYTCYRCGNTGHHIRNCPGDKVMDAPVRIKKSTGIPRSFMVEVDDPSVKGAMLTNCGRFAIPAIDAQAYAIGKKEKPPFVPQEKKESEGEEDPVPDALLCLICHDLLRDAVDIPCCGKSYCDDCIRSALLDSEDHVCPTCSQSSVSPDTLIANKFLRQAVNTFKKDRGHAKNLSTTRSQNPTPTLSQVPTLPTPTPPLQTQPQKPYQTTNSQQDPLRAAESPPSSQVCLAPPTATDLPPASDRPSTSLQTEQGRQETPDKEADEKRHDDSATSAPSAASKESAAAPTQLIPLVNTAPVAEQPKTVSANQQQSSSASRRSGPSASWDSSSSSLAHPPRAWNQSNKQSLPPSNSSSSSSYPPTLPPLFPSPHFPTFLPAQQPLGSYPLGYPPTTPVWTIPTPPGTPIPSLCSSTSASSSSIPALIPKEWYRHHKTKERSPHRGSTYRRSSRSYSQSTKSKSSRSYSRSSSRSRSRSRSRSKGRSRSRHSHSHSHSHSYSTSYICSYKRSRSPTPSSSSSPRKGRRSRSKSPSDRHGHHSRHHGRKSSSSSSSSRRRERGEERRRSHGNVFPQHAGQTGGLELDRERYLQWKREYESWCEQYFSSYVSHFHQLPPPPLLSLPPLPQWGDTGGGRDPSHHGSEPRKRHHGRRSPPSQSSSDSRSPRSHSSSSSRSTPSQSTSDSRSSRSQSSNDSRSPPSRSSSEDGDQPRGDKQSGSSQGNEEKRPKEQNLKNFSAVKNEQKSNKDHEGRRGDESSNAEGRGEKARDASPVQEEGDSFKASESIQPQVKPDKHLDVNHERKRREQTNLEAEKEGRRGKHSDSRHDPERRHKGKSSRGEGRSHSDRYGNPEDSKAADSRSEKDRKRRREDADGGDAKAQSGKRLEGKRAEDPETHKRKSPDPFDRKKQKVEKKKERKTWPPTQRDIWEGGIKVKPQRKISINIKLDGKREEEKAEKPVSTFSEGMAGKIKEDSEKTDNGQTVNRGETEKDINENNNSSTKQIEPNEGETRQLWEKATFRDNYGAEQVSGERNDGEKKEEMEDLNLWDCVLKEKKEEFEEGMETHTRDEMTHEEKRCTWGGEEMGEMAAEGENTKKENAGNLQREWDEELMEGGRWRGEDDEKNKNQSGMEDDGSDQVHLEREMVVKTLGEYSQDGATDKEDRVLIQVPSSKWEREDSEEEEQDEDEVEAQADMLEAFLRSPTATVTGAGRKTEGEVEQERDRSVETRRGEDRAAERVREKGKSSSSHSSRKSMAPSSGRDVSDRGRERERRKEDRRSKEGEKWGDRERKRGQRKRKSPPSSSSHSDWTSRERRDAATHRDTSLHLKSKEKDLSHFCYEEEDPSGKPTKTDITIKPRKGSREDEEMEDGRRDRKKKLTTSKEEKMQPASEEEEQKRKSMKQSRHREEVESGEDTVKEVDDQLYSFVSC